MATTRPAMDDVVVRGFGVGRLVPAPPVCDPGGSSCLVDDFAVADQWVGSIT